MIPRCLIVVLILSWLAGCGSGGSEEYPVAGLVTFNGEPVPTGWVTFLNEQKEKSTAPIGSDGRYQLELVPGDHRVGITAPRESNKTGLDAFKEGPLPPYVPVRFAQPEHSGIVVTVKETDENVIDLPLQGRRAARG